MIKFKINLIFNINKFEKSWWKFNKKSIFYIGFEDDESDDDNDENEEKDNFDFSKKNGMNSTETISD